MEEKTEFHTRDRWLLLSFILGPMSVLLHQSVSYMLVPTACAEGSKGMLHVVTVAFLVICTISALIAAGVHRRFAENGGFLWQERTRWFALVSMILSLSSMLVIVAMEIPNWILRSCD